MNKKLILKSMGYRQLGNSKIYAKPVGFHLLTFDLVKQTLTNCFRSNKTHQICVYNSHEITDDENFLQMLKYHESTSRLSVGNPSDFEFLNSTETFEELL